MQHSLTRWRRPTDRERRKVLSTAMAISAASALVGVSRAFAATTAKETGLSYEGLLKHLPGFQPRRPAPLPIAEIQGFLSKAQLENSYGVYRGAFDELLAAEKSLQTASRDPAHAQEYRALRAQQVTAANSVLLHEFYFRNLAPKTVTPSRYIRGNMREHMGTFDAWRDDFAACARVAEAWAVLVYDPYDDRWHNLPLGKSDAGGMVGTNPLVVCDVSSSAWSKDYRDRDSYVAQFLDHIDWNKVASRYHAVDRH